MSSILAAATCYDMTNAAHTYVLAGCSIIPCFGKRPAVAWEQFTHERASGARVQMWLNSNRMQNIGLVCGAISGGLVVIDVDSREGCAEFEAAFPALLQTLTVISGSGRGKHYYYRVSGNLPANAWRNGIELRSDGAYVVAPPSVHPTSGQPYGVERAFEPLQLSSLESVRRWIIQRGNGGAAAPVTKRPSSTPPRDGSRYGQAALSMEADKVAHAPEGAANNALNLSAFKLGRLVSQGHLSIGEVERVLEAAATALTARDGLEATRRTIQSGLSAGMSKVRLVF